MACFTVPVTEAIITTAAQKILAHREEKTGAENTLHLSERLGSLNKMLWGGSALLAFEHVWHGEITPFFPFLTAANSPESTAEMLREMATSGVAMSLLVTAAWLCMTAVSLAAQKRKGSTSESIAEETVQ
ncbi:MAG: hypothetical protein J6C96_09345 [Oscillospiraceae bacterium]|nr:hypothetical protein [Oscillospiraceae bacterium]